MSQTDTPEMAEHRAKLIAHRALTPDQQRSAMLAGLGQFSPIRSDPGKRIRVGLWMPCLGLGGAEVWQLALAKLSDSARISWRGAVVTDSTHALSPAMEADLSKLMPVGYGLADARALAAQCDVIVSWSVINAAAMLEGLPCPPRVIQALHFPGEASWGPNVSKLLAGVDLFVAVSELALESIPLELRAKASVISNAIDPARLVPTRDRATMRNLWDIPKGAKVFGYLGRLSPEKDPMAAARFAEACPANWKVVVAGDGILRDQLAGSKAIVVGPEPLAGDFLNAIDCLISPSRYESFGLTMAEAAWVGKPIIATRTGIAQLFPGLVKEIQVDATGQEILAAALADHADKRTIRRVRYARNLAHQHFSPGRFGDEWSKILTGSCLSQSEKLAKILVCEERGGVLPLSLQADCGCKGKELSECRSGKGKVAGRVTLADCLACVAS